MKCYIFRQRRYGGEEYWSGGFDDSGAPKVTRKIKTAVCFDKERAAYNAAAQYTRLGQFHVGRRL